MTTQKTARGRPREFDMEAALTIGQRLFHVHGYEAVGLAALTQALGINPPSFYKAFGNKASYFERILARYSQSVLPLESILRPEMNAKDALTDLLLKAARTYGKDPEQRGCLVLHATQGHYAEESVRLARQAADARRTTLRNFIAQENRQAADAVTDYVSSVMAGLSASARAGLSVPRLLAIAKAASANLEPMLSGESKH